jgi:anti-sigma regulatory factor (Ser/Thr protein kinase)
VTVSTLGHDVLFYSGDEEYVAGIREFAGEGVTTGSSVLIAVPEPKLTLLRSALCDVDGGVRFADMGRVGINPARIISFIEAFLDEHSGARVRFVGEPIWAGRTDAETAEGVRHEGLINQAFADTDAHILCPYDIRSLTSDVIGEARRTHPTLWDAGERRPCEEYVDPLETYAAAGHPLPAPPVVPVRVSVSDGLVSFRSAVREQAQAAGLRPERVDCFLIAANEAAANTLLHAGGNGSARIWHDEQELVCEVADTGVIEDPLVGRRMPPADRPGGRGIWLMNQLSDLVELRSGARGTVVRIHMRRDSAGATTQRPPGRVSRISAGGHGRREPPCAPGRDIGRRSR